MSPLGPSRSEPQHPQHEGEPGGSPVAAPRISSTRATSFPYQPEHQSSLEMVALRGATYN
jgi:hypothetical protein